jgi:hypothetical protein
LSSLYLYFLKQYKNTWKSLSLRIRIEIIILFIVYFTFFTTRLIQIINEQLSDPNISSFGLNQFILHVLIFLLSFTIPFIHLNLLPKQKGLVYYRTLPLNKLNTFWLVFLLHYKYQLIGLLIILPVFISSLFTLNTILSFYFIFGIILYQTIFILYISDFAMQTKNTFIPFFKYFSLFLIVFGVYFSMYFYTDYYFLFDVVFFTASLIYLIPRWKSNCFNWDSYIKITKGKSKSKNNKSRLISYSLIQKFPISKISPLLAKEMLNYLRNRKYIRIQIISLILFTCLLLILHFKVEENFVIYSSAVTILFIWQHFSLQFNEKYIKAESAVFIKTLPFKYYQIWLAKFISEFLFIFILLLFLTILYLLMGLLITEIYQSLFVIIIFSLLVFATIINFKLIFFDRPRFAGYAYHFFIIFVAVMSINYYLVGPIITSILLIYFTFYSYREFAR